MSDLLLSPKVLAICIKKNLIPLRILDTYKNFVVLCASEKYGNIILKTDNLQNEYIVYKEIRKIIKSKQFKYLKFPKIIEKGMDYLIIEFMKGNKADDDFYFYKQNFLKLPYYELILRAFWELKSLLDNNSVMKNLSKKDCPPNLTIDDWFKKAIKKQCGLILKNKTRKLIDKEFTEKIIENVTKWCRKNKQFNHLCLTFGVFGQYQLIIRENRVYLTDFGGHLEFRAPFHDLAWLMKWEILHLPYCRLVSDFECLLKNLKTFEEKAYFLAPQIYREKINFEQFRQLYAINFLEILFRCKENISRKNTNHIRFFQDKHLWLLNNFIDNLIKEYAKLFQ